MNDDVLVTRSSTIHDPATPAGDVAVHDVPTAEQPVIRESVVQPDLVERRTSRFTFAFDAVLAGGAGLFLLVVGLVAVTRAGFDRDLMNPAVDVLGFGHTALLGLIEVGAGLLLLAAGVTRSRQGATFFGTALFVAGLVGGIQADSFQRSLALDAAWAWLLAIAGAVIALAALLVPRYETRRTVYRTR